MKKITRQDGTYEVTRYIYNAGGNVMATFSYESNTATRSLENLYMYGSRRLGSISPLNHTDMQTLVNHTGEDLRFEITDHLGNVRTVVSGLDQNGQFEVYSMADYYPFGMMMPGRKKQPDMYKYGYQGSERDPEMFGGHSYTTFFRDLDTRLGRWISLDPVTHPWQSPYVSMDNNPIALIDIWGASAGGPGENEDDIITGADGNKYKVSADAVVISPDDVFVKVSENVEYPEPSLWQRLVWGEERLTEWMRGNARFSFGFEFITRDGKPVGSYRDANKVPLEKADNVYTLNYDDLMDISSGYKSIFKSKYKQKSFEQQAKDKINGFHKGVKATGFKSSKDKRSAMIQVSTNSNTVEIINKNNLSEDKNSTSSTSNNNNEAIKTKKDTSISIMITEQYHGYSRHSVLDTNVNKRDVNKIKRKRKIDRR